MSDTQDQGPDSGTVSSQPDAPIAVPDGVREAIGGGQQPRTDSTQEPAQAQPTQRQLSEMAQALLKDIPEEQREMFEPFVNKWDAGVTRRFQELQSKVAPFEPFLEQGVDQEGLVEAMQLRQFFDEDPLALAQTILRNHPEFQGQQGPGAQPAGMSDEEYGELHPQVVSWMQNQQQQTDQMRAMVEAMAGQMMQSQRSVAEQQEDAQLDQYLSLLRTEFGDFDEDFVLSKMERGIDGAEAAKQYQSMLQEALDQRMGGQQGGNGMFDQNGQANPGGAASPAILSGGSHAPQQRSILEASDKETKNLVVEMLKQANKA